MEATTDDSTLWHQWKMDGEDIDIFAFEHEYHNGPQCERCGEMYCHHCERDCYRYVCPEAAAPSRSD